ncbi:DUF3592 domain-containing protein [Rubellimicrobium roseum]|nr:DUF3592 domain-containing protein [Rubellimicrobium roseum]
MFVEFLKRGGVAAAVLLVIAAMLGAAAHRENAVARALAEHGVPAVATVVDKRTETIRTRTDDGTRTRTSHEVAYAYEALATDGSLQPLTVRHAVPRRIHDALRLGDRVEIRYLPQSPTRAEVYPGEAASGVTLLGALALVALLAAALAARIGLALARRAIGSGRPAARPETAPRRVALI